MYLFKVILFLLCAFFYVCASAQDTSKYFGGSYDGFVTGNISQSALNGTSVDLAKYFGGSYDGFDLSDISQTSLGGTNINLAKYFGGSYDGFVLSDISQSSLGGTNINIAKYFGGSYDGFVLSDISQTSLGGTIINLAKYFGGSYDGFVLTDISQSSLGGTTINLAKYFGGSYDGFVLSDISQSSLGGSTINLAKYYGGAYDGFAMRNLEEIPLFITLKSISHSVLRNNVKLIWDVIQEYNNKGFYIERTPDGLNEWKKISFVSGRGNANTPMTYTFSDSKLKSGKYKYRIKQVDYSGYEFYYNLKNTVEIGTPDKFSLLQNYPNPFNPVTKIDFDIPVDENVNLKLFDITGRLVRTLIDEKLSAGYYTIEFHSGNLASGVYFYRLSTNSFLTSKKMTVLK